MTLVIKFAARSRIELCINDIKMWMTVNMTALTHALVTSCLDNGTLFCMEVLNANEVNYKLLRILQHVCLHGPEN